MNRRFFAPKYFFVALSLILGIGLFAYADSASAAAISWDSGGANNDWETVENWSGDAVPTDADDVTIDYAETIAINATTTVNSLTVGGTNATVLNFDYDAITGGALIIDAGNLTVAANGTITHTGGSTSSVLATVFIDVQTGDATITGTVNVDGKGYAKGYGTGKGTGFGGGGYGGEGSAGNGGTGGTTYGSITAPTDLGSGGSGSCNGGAGAGSVKLLVAGGLTVAGSISATGATSNEWCASPGSGGSIYLDAGTFAGAGTVDVNGGAYSYFNAGQGGGGRLAIYYDTNTYSGTPTAYGGYDASNGYYAGAGTVYIKDNADTYGSLTVDNNSHDMTTDDRYLGKTNLSSTATYKNLTISNDGHIDLISGATITVDSTFTWTGGNVTDSGGVLATITSGDVVVPAGSYFYANTARTGAGALTSLTINGVLTHSTNSTLTSYVLDVETTGATDIATGGSVNVAARGLQRGYGTGAASGDRSGAGYGGEGGTGYTLAGGGTTYGSITAPTSLGSGGFSGCASGNGGGAIKLTVGGTLTVTGSITASGGASGEWCGGGGSGGSIYLDTGTITGAGAITSAGGAATTADAGNGGGGRIAIYYDASTYSGTPTAYGGYFSTNYFGGAGTIYIKDNADTYGSLTVDNNSRDITTDDRYYGKTNLSSTATYKNITISNDGHIDLISGATITVDSTLTWTGGNITDSGGVLSSVNSGDVVIPANARFLANTTRSVTSLTVNGTMTHSKNTTVETHKINYTTSADVTIGASGTINVTQQGFIGGYGDGHGHDAGAYGSGGGYGGVGGDTADGGDTGGITYGSETAPSNLGSGGMGEGASNLGSSGGGAVKLSVGGNLSIGGTIVANGGSDYSGWFLNYGGGSGGSIWLAVSGAISGGGNVSAQGSSAQSAGAGAGGGGRIAMTAASSTWSGSASVIAGTTGYAGGVGTVYDNYAPTAGNPSNTFATDGTGEMLVSLVVDDPDDETLSLKVEYSMDGGGTWEDPTLSETLGDTTASFGTPATENDNAYQISSVITSSGANTIAFVWNSKTDEPTGDVTNAKIRVTVNDGGMDGTPATSTNTTLDNAAPTGLADLAVTAYPSTSLSLSWTAATSESHFDHYELWYGSNSSDVNNRTGSATEWDNADDGALATMSTTSTTITGLSQNVTYYVKIWAVDDYTNEATLVAISQKTNGLPTAATVTPTFATDGTGRTTVTVIIDDADDQTSSFKVEYSTNGGGAWADPTLSTTAEDLSGTFGTPALNNASTYQISNVTTASGANTISFVWNSGTDVPTADVSNALIRITPYDGAEAGSGVNSASFSMDNADPSGMAGLGVGSYASDEVVMTWTAVSSETNFDHYELWYGTNSSDVDNRTGTATEWDNSDDATLATMTTATTTIPSLVANTTYYIKVWAVDDYGNEATLASSTQKTNAIVTATTPTATVATDGTGEVTVVTTIDDADDEDSRFLVEYSIDGGGTYAKATLSETDVDTTATYGDPDVANVNSYQVGNASGYVTTASGANAVTFIWNSHTDVPTADVTNAKIRVTPNDQIEDGTAMPSANFTLDNAHPQALADFVVSAKSATSVTLTWTAATDTHFSHYEIWYGEDSGDVDGRTGTATEWDNSDDAALATATTATTRILPLESATTYFFKIFAVDDYTNETTQAATSVKTSSRGSTASRPTPAPDLTNLTVSQDDGTTTASLMEEKWTSVNWLSLGAVPNVNVYYSVDEGVNWLKFVGPIANRDNIGFVMPAGLGTTFMLRVIGTDLAVNLDTETTGILTLIPRPMTVEPEAPSVVYKPVEPIYPTDPWLGVPDLNPEWPQETAPFIPPVKETPTVIPGQSPIITYTEPEAISPVTGLEEPVSDVQPGDYIKSPSFPTVYYVTEDLARKPFADAQTYFTYEASFDRIKVVTDATLTLLNLSGPMLPKPSTVLVKIQSDPKVYVVSENPENPYRPILRWLSSEELATTLYGAHWSDYVIDVPVTLFARFEIGNAIGLLDFQSAFEKSAMKLRSAIVR
ncbi:MAG: fibronectin type III domain-containing protein [Patescibacteria group bacterium]